MRGATIPAIEERLTSVESAIDAILELNTHVVQSLADQQRRTIAMEKWAESTEKRAAAMEKRAAAMEKRAEAMEQNLESVRRFDRQTRKLWIMIARKVDWLDEDDINRWETEDL